MGPIGAICGGIAACGAIYFIGGSILHPDDKAGPFETVDAFYYPDRSNMSKVISFNGFDDAEQCRIWVQVQANVHGDYQLRRGDYECGVGKTRDLGNGVTMYRLTVR